MKNSLYRIHTTLEAKSLWKQQFSAVNVVGKPEILNFILHEGLEFQFMSHEIVILSFLYDIVA